MKLAREGHSHPVPLIIGTDKHEAALFKWMKSPLMPITPEAINAMFTEIAAEQPTLQLPTEDKIGTAYPGLRAKARGMGVARDVGFRMPSVWLAEGHSTVPLRLRDADAAVARIAAAHATEWPFVWGNLVTGCGQTWPKRVASATSVQRSGGSGARHLRSPIGGGAYRTPFHAVTCPSS